MGLGGQFFRGLSTYGTQPITNYCSSLADFTPVITANYGTINHHQYTNTHLVNRPMRPNAAVSPHNNKTSKKACVEGAERSWPS